MHLFVCRCHLRGCHGYWIPHRADRRLQSRSRLPRYWEDQKYCNQQQWSHRQLWRREWTIIRLCLYIITITLLLWDVGVLCPPQMSFTGCSPSPFASRAPSFLFCSNPLPRIPPLPRSASGSLPLWHQLGHNFQRPIICHYFYWICFKYMNLLMIYYIIKNT